MRSWIITLIIVASVQLVNAATLSEEIQLALKRGEVSSFTTDIADHMGIERSLPYRALEVEEKGTFHDFNVVVKDEKPLCLILIVSSDTVTELHGTVFRSSLKGKHRSQVDAGGEGGVLAGARFLAQGYVSQAAGGLGGLCDTGSLGSGRRPSFLRGGFCHY